MIATKESWKKTIYIAGPMRGIELFNFPAFDTAAKLLRENGWGVISPAELDREAGFDPANPATPWPENYDWKDLKKIGFDIRDAVRRDADALAKCDAIYLLEGWENSKGAKAEKAMAEWLGLEIKYQDLDYNMAKLAKEWREREFNFLFNPLAIQKLKATYHPLDAEELKAIRDRDANDPKGKYTIPPIMAEVPISLINETDDVVKRHLEKSGIFSFDPSEGQTITNEQGGSQSFIAARFDCIPPECLRLLAQCLGFGARKYGKENWKNIPFDDNLAHAMNHINEWRLGDRTEPHLVNTMARITFALWQAVDSGEQPPQYIHPDMQMSK